MAEKWITVMTNRVIADCSAVQIVTPQLASRSSQTVRMWRDACNFSARSAAGISTLLIKSRRKTNGREEYRDRSA
jgi:hypothetical protein